MMRIRVMILAGALLAATQAQGQLAENFNLPPANCCLVNTARSLADQLQDWNQLGRYHAANEALKKQPAEPGRVVFMGDSITDFWRLEEYFPGQPYVNRGIGGQTTPQMLVRMYPDVIELKPAAMVVLAGTNDIARNTGPSTAEMIQQNIMAMSDLARQNRIKVVLCSILPVSDYAFLAQERAGGPPAAGRGGAPGRGPMPRMRMTTNHPAGDILRLNAWMQQYAQRVDAVYVDYFSAMVDEKGWLKESLANDGLHPNAEGYKMMAALASAAIQKALR